MLLDSRNLLLRHFMPHQIAWIEAELPLHARGLQAIALAKKSVRIGWTYADAFKNVRKRLWHKNRDYLLDLKSRLRAGIVLRAPGSRLRSTGVELFPSA